LTIAALTYDVELLNLHGPFGRPCERSQDESAPTTTLSPTRTSR
jgi:hypothetical protein